MKFDLASGFFISIFCISSLAMEPDPRAANSALVENTKNEMLKQFIDLPNLKSTQTFLAALEEKDQQLCEHMLSFGDSLLPEFLAIVYNNIEKYIEEYKERENDIWPQYLALKIKHQLYTIGCLVEKRIGKSHNDISELYGYVDNLFEKASISPVKELLISSLKTCFKCLFNAKVEPKTYVAIAYNSLLSPSNKTSEDQGKKFIDDLVQSEPKYDDIEPSFSNKENQKIKYLKYESYNTTASKARNNIYRILPR
jgi:hypothetical protein